MSNCRTGDIARIVNMPPQLAQASDRFVRCVAACEIRGEPAWILEERVNFTILSAGRSLPSGEVFQAGDKIYIDRIQDKYLRPIRDSDGEDEMLRLAGRPNETPADLIREFAPHPQWEFAR